MNVTETGIEIGIETGTGTEGMIETEIETGVGDREVWRGGSRDREI